MKILNVLSSAIANDSLSEAEAALSEYVDPAVRALKSCYIFEKSEAIKENILKVIHIYEPNFLAERSDTEEAKSNNLIN